MTSKPSTVRQYLSDSICYSTTAPSIPARHPPICIIRKSVAIQGSMCQSHSSSGEYQTRFIMSKCTCVTGKQFPVYNKHFGTPLVHRHFSRRSRFNPNDQLLLLNNGAAAQPRLVMQRERILQVLTEMEDTPKEVNSEDRDDVLEWVARGLFSSYIRVNL